MINDLFLRELVDSISQFVNEKNSAKLPISLHEPDLVNTNSLDYLKNCIESNWVSSGGEWVKRFEKYLCEYTRAKYAIAVCNGTVALRLALYIVGVRSNEEVLVTPSSFVATANAISHLGASPHFVDIEPETLTISATKLNNRLEKIAIKRDGFLFNKITNKRIAALLPVHVFGIPGNLAPLKEISKNWNLPIIEDSAEALGSWYKYDSNLMHCGLMGDIGILSFNGNKIITTGGGGALLTDNKLYAEQARHLSTTAKIPHPWEFFHDQIGWNDRMPNINAAIGCAQIEKINQILDKKKKIYEKYNKIFSSFDFVELVKKSKNSTTNNWLVTFRLIIKDDDYALNIRNKILELAHRNKILLRPIWKSLYKMPMYLDCQRDDLSEADFQEKRLINLPSSVKLLK